MKKIIDWYSKKSKVAEQVFEESSYILLLSKILYLIFYCAISYDKLDFENIVFNVCTVKTYINKTEHWYITK